MKSIVCALLITLLTYSTLLAAEVINLKVGQSGDKGFATYDLAGKIGEREAEVTVSLTINGEKYSADKLTMTGDLGTKVKTGVGRRIIWDILADIPTGFDGEVLWNVDTANNLTAAAGTDPKKPSFPQTSSDSPFEFGELAVRDKNTGLLWLREASRDGKGKSPFDARGVTSRLSAEKFAGCSEWNLPEADELTKIVGYAIEAGYTGKKGKGYPADYFNAIGFKSVRNDYYWTYDPRPNWNKMTVDLEDGNTMERSNKDYLQVWPVCKPDTLDAKEVPKLVATGVPAQASGPQKPVSTSSLKDSPFEISDLVGRDKNTGLLWLREVSKDGNGVDFNKARGTAIKLAANKFAGCSDWRLPAADDLTKIVTYALETGYQGKKSRGYPADYFNTIGFKGVANDYYWTGFTSPRFGAQHTHRVAVDMEDGIGTDKELKDYLQFWPVCKPD